MNYKLSLILMVVPLLLALGVVGAQYPSVVDTSSSSAGVGPLINPDGTYTFIVDAPSGAFTSVTLMINGQSYSMTYENTHWIVVVSGVSSGDIYFYNIVTASGVVFNGAQQTL